MAAPAEILSEIFLFLSRNDISKCQLVNHNWNLVIKRLPEGVLPLFIFHCLDIDRKRKRKNGAGSKNMNFLEVLLYKHPNSGGIRVFQDENMVKNLKSCFFQKIFNYKNPSKTLVDVYKTIFETTKTKIATKEFIFWGKSLPYLTEILSFVNITEEVRMRRFEIAVHMVENDRISMQIWKNGQMGGEFEKIWFNFEYALWSLNKQALNYFLMFDNELVDAEKDEVHVYLPKESIDIYMQILVEEFRSSTHPEKFISNLYIFPQPNDYEDDEEEENVQGSKNICLMFFKRIYGTSNDDDKLVFTRETDLWSLHIEIFDDQNFIKVSKKFSIE